MCYVPLMAHRTERHACASGQKTVRTHAVSIYDTIDKASLWRPSAQHHRLCVGMSGASWLRWSCNRVTICCAMRSRGDHVATEAGQRGLVNLSGPAQQTNTHVCAWSHSSR